MYKLFSSCSICTKKQNRHFIVPGKYFKLLQVNQILNSIKWWKHFMPFTIPWFVFPFSQGSDNLTTYTFNTHIAKHTFCKTCGVQSFYTPRSNPDGYGTIIYSSLYFRHDCHMCSKQITPYSTPTPRCLIDCIMSVIFICSTICSK